MSATSPAVPPTPAGDLTWTPAWKIREMVGRREISPLEVTEHFLSRIEALEPVLHAFRTFDPEGARRQARRATDAVARGDALGPLHGIPISIKEHINVAGLPNWTITAQGGTGVAAADAILVERLRRAGAIIVGTTIMPGVGTDPTMPDLANHPRNPWDTARIPGTSTAGGAASVAAGMTPLTIGSDGAGSVRLPAAMSGIIGFHTSEGRVPAVDYEAPVVTQGGSTGPLARNVRDAAIVMQAIAGPDGRDPFVIRTAAPDYLTGLDDGVSGLRLAWTDDFGFAAEHAVEETPDVVTAIRDAASRFVELGAKVEAADESWEDYWPAFTAMTSAYGPPLTVVAFAASHTSDSLQAGQELYGRNWDRFERVFERHDLLLSPTLQFTAPTVAEWDVFCKRTDHRRSNFMATYGTYTHLFNIYGYPAVSVPCGFLHGRPIGLQIVGRPHQEALILRAASAFLGGLSVEPPPAFA
ncbi:amidase [Streptomyces phaeochromogenes]|uniref:amidase n=1 Tax=Streptomyces phaeochromogenes TaxID=1923 RepID=UPI002DDB7F7C|nr:amidase [Streptomyces phaeochromogenes]WRZ34549.1 amidase [Streptomyces phaeochromogenes]